MPSGGGAPYTQQSPPPNQILASNFVVGTVGRGVFYRVNGDFDGDGKLNFAVFNGNANPNVGDPTAGMWFIVPSGTPTARFPPVLWGVPGDIPVPGFYEGGTTSDVAVFRPSTGTWYIKPSNSTISRSVGLTNDIPVIGDFDGDGITDFVVWRPSNGVWYCILSSKGPSSPVIQQWGLPPYL
jgi:hypothetical protein